MNSNNPTSSSPLAMPQSNVPSSDNAEERLLQEMAALSMNDTAASRPVCRISAIPSGNFTVNNTVNSAAASMANNGPSVGQPAYAHSRALPAKSNRTGISNRVPVAVVYPTSLRPERLEDLSESEKQTFARLLEIEYSRNAFSVFYKRKYRPTREPPQRDLPEAHQAARVILDEYTHDDAVEFMAISHVWKHRAPPTLERRTGGLVECVYQYRAVEGVKAIYRVIREEENKYILLACHMNVHALHRGDLRFVEVNSFTRARGFDYSCVGKMAIGDLIAVTELARTPIMPANMGVVDTRTVDEKTPCVWMVKKMTMICRKVFNYHLFTILSNKMAVVETFGEAMIIKDNYLNDDFRDSVFFGSGFVPEKIFYDFANGFNNWNRIHSLAARVKKYPNAMGTILKYSESRRYTDYFHIGTSAFAEPSVRSEEIAQFCISVGISAINAIKIGRFDSRTFKMMSPERHGDLIMFSIRNPSDQPTLGLWRANTHIIVGGHQDTADAVIETVLSEGKCLRIVARLSRQHNGFQFTDRLHMVAQREQREPSSLAPNFLRNMLPSNGRHIIETLYGLPPEVHKPLDFNYPIHFPSPIPISLNDYQAEYVNRILLMTPMTVANAPFGCGKSMTIVTAAVLTIQKWRAHGFNRQALLVTQSNFASVNLVDILCKTSQIQCGVRAVRFVSERNWNELPDDCRTDLDLPIQMYALFEACVIGSFPWLLSDQVLIQAAVYLLDRGLIEVHRMAPRVQHLVAKEGHTTKRWAYDACISMFFQLANQSIIVVTADSLSWVACHLHDVATVQFDEASQLPETTLIKVLVNFPYASFGLVGDINQLPPYSEKELTGYVKQFGVGEAMKRAVVNNLFPQAHLKIVYRCHPAITELLGRMFYNSDLISGVTVEQRTSIIRKRPDFWPNVNFPIVVMENPTREHQMGTSFSNEGELVLVAHIVNLLINPPQKCGQPMLFPVRPSDIGIISFYKAQTSKLTEQFRAQRIKCGTVDSFQGAEKEVIILCTTRSVLTDFLICPNRINVALSRGKQSTIIVGSRTALEKAPHWGVVLKEAVANGTVI